MQRERSDRRLKLIDQALLWWVEKLQPGEKNRRAEMSTRPRWGDELDEEELLPPNTESGPDENGIKTIVEYYRNDKGDAMKRTTKVKVVSVQQKVYKISEVRHNWKRFGEAASGNEGITGKSHEEIPFEPTRRQKQTMQEKKVTDLKQAIATQDNQTIVGSLKDMLYKKRMERELRRAKGLLEEPEKPPTEDDPAAMQSALKSSSYVPPSLRNRPAGSSAPEPPKRYDTNSVRVTNLAEEVTEQDLHELFSPFGQISRVFLALDRETHRSRGFAFVNYVRREDAARAIKALDGHGYANLILHVEWATPREKR